MAFPEDANAPVKDALSPIVMGSAACAAKLKAIASVTANDVRQTLRRNDRRGTTVSSGPRLFGV